MICYNFALRVNKNWLTKKEIEVFLGWKKYIFVPKCVLTWSKFWVHTYFKKRKHCHSEYKKRTYLNIKSKDSYTASRNVLWKMVPYYKVKLKTCTNCDPAPLFLCIHPKNTLLTCTGNYVQEFSITLSINTKTWKQPKCPAREEWIHYTHTVKKCSSFLLLT